MGNPLPSAFAVENVNHGSDNAGKHKAVLKPLSSINTGVPPHQQNSFVTYLKPRQPKDSASGNTQHYTF